MPASFRYRRMRRRFVRNLMTGLAIGLGITAFTWIVLALARLFIMQVS